MDYQIQIGQAEPQTTAVVRRQASLAELTKVVPHGCGVVWKTIKPLQLSGVGRNLALYLDDVIHLEVGVEVEAPFPGHGEVVGSTIPGGRVATTTHVGPYDRLSEAHVAIRQYCSAHGLAIAGPNWEIYDHWTEDPAQLRTDVFYLLQDA